MIYFLIFFQKIVENALSSFRAIVYTAGHKHIGAVIILINSAFWLYIVIIVISDLNSDPIKVLIYAVGQVVGVYIGMVIEEKLAIGKSLLYVIITKKNEDIITNQLRNQGYAVTSIEAKGHDNSDKALLLILCKRKNKDSIRTTINSFEKEVLIMSKSPTNFVGGYVN